MPIVNKVGRCVCLCVWAIFGNFWKWSKKRVQSSTLDMEKLWAENLTPVIIKDSHTTSTKALT